MTTIVRTSARLSLVAVVAAGLVGPGCVPAQNRLSVTGAADMCSAQRTKLGTSESFFAQNIIEGAAVGAVGGALMGALIGAASGDVGRGALIGAGAGLLAGGTYGYFQARSQNAADYGSLARTIGADASREGAEIDRATVTFLALKDCRFRQAETIKADLARGVITRPEAEARMAETRRLFDEELALAHELGANMDRRNEEMQAASTQLIQQNAQVESYAAKLPPPVVPTYTSTTSGSVSTVGGDDPTTTVRAAVRAKPSPSGKSLTVLPPNSRVTITGPEADGWVPVRTANGTEGYVRTAQIGNGPVKVAAPEAPKTVAPVAPQTQVAAVVPADAPADVRAAVETVQITQANQKRRQTYNDVVVAAAQEKEVQFSFDTAPTARSGGDPLVRQA